MTIDTKAIREALAAATPGPWQNGTWRGQCHKKHDTPHHPGPGSGCVYDYSVSADSENDRRCIIGAEPVEICGYNDYGPVLSAADARLIVLLRNAAAALCDMAERADGETK